MKNSLKSWLRIIEEKVSEIEDMSIKIIHMKKRKKD